MFRLYIALSLFISLVAARELLITPVPAHIDYDGAAEQLVRCRPVISAHSPALLHAKRSVTAIVEDHLGFLPHPSAHQPRVTLALVASEAVSANALGQDPHLDQDESYKLRYTGTSGAAGAEVAAFELVSGSRAGFVHGAATFVQLWDATFTQDTDAPDAAAVALPALIDDAPRFAWRGLMLDVARHFIPLGEIRALVRSMSLVHLNVLHLHLSDAQAWPLDVAIAPELAEQGAYRTGARRWAYSASAVAELRAYALRRGVRVVAEIDLPGHAFAIGRSHPELVLGQCGGRNINNVPVNVVHPGAADFVSNVIAEVMGVFDDEFVHLGGDEVVHSCYKNDPATRTYMAEHNIEDTHALVADFFARIDGPFAGGKSRVFWNEAAEAGVDIRDRDIVQVWTGAASLQRALDAGRGRGVVYSAPYYLDKQVPSVHGHTSYLWGDTYMDLYEFEPSSVDNSERILGAEVTVWTEQVSPQSLGARVWPRAAAVAERFWSRQEVCDNVYKAGAKAMAPRINALSCRILATGMAAMPLREGRPCPVAYAASLSNAPAF